MSENNGGIFEFGPFRLDVAEHTLSRTDGAATRHLPEKAFQTLRILVEKSGQLFTKHELIEKVWPDSIVEENNLDKCIHAVRQVLGETATEQKYIQTVRKHGYRFVAEVRAIPPDINGAALAIPQGALPKNTNAPGTNRYAFATLTAASGLLVTIVLAGFYIVWTREAAPPHPTTIAVLPLKPVNMAERSAFHEGGILDSLILRLGSAGGLTVRPLSAMRKYLDVDQDALAAGREQMVDYVLAANYQVAGGRIQITGQLLEVKTGAVSETFKIEKESAESFAVQDSIAREIGDIVTARFGTGSDALISKRGTANENAYMHYLNAANLMGRTSSLPVAQESVEYLEEAIRLDPRFARGYAALARSRVDLSNLVDDPHSDCEKAGLAVERAFSLDASLTEAYQASGLRKQRCEWDFAGAESDLRRAVEMDQHSDTAHAAYGAYLNTVGRFDEAIAETETAIGLNPSSLVHHKQLGIIFYCARRYDAAIVELNHASKLGQLGLANGWLWTSYVANGQEREAFQCLLRYESGKGPKPDPARIEQLKEVLTTKGWKGIRELQRDEEVASPIYVKGRFYRIARLCAQLGNIDDAFLYLDKAFERRDAQLLLLRSEPTFDPLRTDPRFLQLLRRTGFPPVS
jgi:DNA-binding winged helix-turn-helix (wHTH) protein/TolB-like protein